MSAVALKLTVTDDGAGTIRLLLDGELDLATAPLLEDQLAAIQPADARQVILDLRSLTFLDSSGLRSLLAAKRTAGEMDYRLAIHNPQQQPRRFFALTQTENILNVTHSAP